MPMCRNKNKLSGLVVFLCIFFILLSYSTFADPATTKRKLASEMNLSGEQALQNNEDEKALELFKKAAKLDSTYDVPHANMAKYYKRWNIKDKAIEEYKTAIDLNPDNADYYLSLADIYRDEKKYDEAIRTLNKAKKINPDKPQIYFDLGLMYKTMGYNAEAIDNFTVLQRILEKDNAWKLNQDYKSIYWMSHKHLGEIYQGMKKWDLAYQHYNAILNSEENEILKRSIESNFKTVMQQKNQLQYGMIGSIVALTFIIGLLIFWKIAVAPQVKEPKSTELPPSAMDAKDYKTLARFAVQHMGMLTKLPKALVYFVRRQGEPLFLAYAENLEADKFNSLSVNWDEISNWLTANQGLPFVYEAEKKGSLFMRAFPGGREKLDPAGPRVGIPIIHENTLRGLIFMCYPQITDKKKFKSIFKKNIGLIKKISQQIGAGADKIFRREASILDSITSAYNHFHFKEKLPDAVFKARNRRSSVSIIMFECDGIPAIQKRYGDEKANYVLSTVVQTIKDKIDVKEMMIFRLSDYLFSIILPGLDVEQGKETAIKLMELISSIQFTTPIPTITATLGMATYPDHAEDEKRLEEVVRKALEKAINSGRNRLIIETGSSIFPPSSRLSGAKPKSVKLPETSEVGSLPGDLKTSKPSISIAPPPEEKEKPKEAEKTYESDLLSPLTFRSAQKTQPTSLRGVPVRPTESTTVFETDSGKISREVRPSSKQEDKTGIIRKDGKDFVPIKPESAQVEKAQSIPAWKKNMESSSIEKPAAPDSSKLRRPPKMREVGSDTSRLPPLPKSMEAKKPMVGLIRRSKTAGQAPDIKRRGYDAYPPESMPLDQIPQIKEAVVEEKIESQKKFPSGSLGPKKIEFTPKPVTTETKVIQEIPIEAPPPAGRIPPSTPLRKQPATPVGTTFLPKLALKTFTPSTKTPFAKPGEDRKKTAPPAAKDPVTGFFLKSFFEQSIGRFVVRASQTKRPLALMFFKLDKHKELKGKYGQEKLNNVLSEISEMIETFLKEGSDIPARYSDEIFVLILPDTSFQIAFNLAEQIRFTVGNLNFRDIPGQINLSLGIASFPDKGKSPKEVMKNSYDAMVYAIKSGGNRTAIWDENLFKK